MYFCDLCVFVFEREGKRKIKRKRKRKGMMGKEQSVLRTSPCDVALEHTSLMATEVPYTEVRSRECHIWLVEHASQGRTMMENPSSCTGKLVECEEAC